MFPFFSLWWALVAKNRSPPVINTYKYDAGVDKDGLRDVHNRVRNYFKPVKNIKNNYLILKHENILSPQTYDLLLGPFSGFVFNLSITAINTLSEDLKFFNIFSTTLKLLCWHDMTLLNIKLCKCRIPPFHVYNIW